MATYDPRPAAGLTTARKSLLGVYAALDERLRLELQYVGVRLPAGLDPVAQLVRVAEHRDEDERPALHQLQLAFATMAVLGRELTPQEVDGLRVVAAELAEPQIQPAGDAAGAILGALQAAAAADMPARERWTAVVNAVGNQLHPDLRKIKGAWCEAGLRPYGDEFVSRVETELVVAEPRELDQLSLAVLPENWKHCNDFFCDLIPAPGRDAACPGSTGGRLAPALHHWRGVYEERVGECPQGWFPDTFLLFTWDRTANQIILRYELAPRRREDRTVLRVDRGYIQVDRLPGTYRVSTVKYLLFDDQFIPGGGQVLGGAACQLGWLDYSLNQFTACPDAIGRSGTASPAAEPTTGGGFDAGPQRVLDQCQEHLLEAASEADRRFSRAVRRLRNGRYTLDDYVNDWAGAAGQGIRDGARSLAGQAALARELIEIADRLSGRGGSR